MSRSRNRRSAARYVKFEGADWTLDGTTESGLFPILPVAKTWKLDKNRKPSVLKVKRKQIPLVPAFAITAHASQGKTLPLDGTQATAPSCRRCADRIIHNGLTLPISAQALPRKLTCTPFPWLRHLTM